MDRMARPEKMITVRIREWISHHETIQYDGHEQRIDGGRTVQDAVRAVYPAFPSVCRRVVLIRGPRGV